MKKLITKIVLLIILCSSIFVYCPSAIAKETINIGFNIDNKYTIWTILTINSILINNTSKSNYKFYVIESNLAARNKNRLKKYVNKNNQEIEFIHLDKSNIEKFDSLYKSINLPQVSLISTGRIFLPTLIKDDIDRLLYIDADLIATTDLSKLYSINMGNKTIAMSEDMLGREYAKGKFKEYYNAGVILIDMKKWKKDKITEKIIDYWNENYDKFTPSNEAVSENKIYRYADQDIINLVLVGKIKPLSQNWNYQLRDTVPEGILHYSTAKKPWLFAEKSPANVKYYQYWTNSDQNYLFGVFILKFMANKFVKFFT